ncbi:unnamed protein product [Euphydryas editha]|uniref:Gag-like protein n=1 Tax=Euphydryas editha TaxID=104508 RepID=A0AAU9VD85_EUPED|nr:unnamed protein product [Euphydryas editha]
MPKQFALAKILQNAGIGEIKKVKYVNPYKIRLETNNSWAEKIEECKEFTDRGWRIQRAMEVSLCYGVIKDVDIDLKDEDILNKILCPEPATLISVCRLKRREHSSEGNIWKPSESVRLCFRGSFRPSHVTVDSLCIRVDPYVFPVSQCTRCWKLGHVTSKCSSLKVVCPKCSGPHENCNTTVFKCANCEGQHFSLLRSCPAYVKERKLRELMAEFNCTYRRALTMYVPSSCTEAKESRANLKQRNKEVSSTPEPATTTPYLEQSYSDVVKQTIVQAEINAKKNISHSNKKYKKEKEADYQRQAPIDIGAPSTWAEEEQQEEKKKRDVTFNELLSRLQEILFLRGVSMQTKVISMSKCCLEWLILIAVENISEWPILQSILNFFNS